MQLLSTTPGQVMRGVETQEANLQQLLSDRRYKDALTDWQGAQTDRYKQETPYSVLEMQQKTDPGLFSSGKEKTIAENTQAKMKAMEWIKKAPTRELMESWQTSLVGSAQMVQSWNQIINSTPSLAEALPLIRKSLPQDNPDLAKPALQAFEQISQGVQRGEITKETATQYLSKMSQSLMEASAYTDPEFVRQILLQGAKNQGGGSDKITPLQYLGGQLAGRGASESDTIKTLQSITPGFGTVQQEKGFSMGTDAQGNPTATNFATKGVTPFGQGQPQSQLPPGTPLMYQGQHTGGTLTNVQELGQPVSPEESAAALREEMLKRRAKQPPKTSGQPAMSNTAPSAGSAQQPYEEFSNTDLQKAAPPGAQKPGASNPINTYLNLNPRADDMTMHRYRMRLLDNYKVLYQHLEKNKNTLSKEEKARINKALTDIKAIVTEKD